MTEYDKNGYPIIKGSSGTTSYDRNGYPTIPKAGSGGSSGPSVNARFGGKSPSSDVNSILGNAIRQTGEIIHGIPTAVTQVGAATWHDLSGGKVNDPRLNDWSFLFKHPIGYGQAWLHDPSTVGGAVIRPQITAVSRDATALRRGDWGYFERNPLNPILDVASVASVGGKALRVAGERGVLGARAAEFTHAPRTLTVGDHTEILRQSRTLQGQIRQRLFDRYSMAYPDRPLTGANVRMQGILSKRAATSALRAGLSAREFERATNGLTPAEVFAFHVGAEGVPLADRMAYYQAQLAERTVETSGKATRPLQEYLANLDAPAVKDVLENPRPRVHHCAPVGEGVGGEGGATLGGDGTVDAGDAA